MKRIIQWYLHSSGIFIFLILLTICGCCRLREPVGRTHSECGNLYHLLGKNAEALTQAATKYGLVQVTSTLKVDLAELSDAARRGGILGYYACLARDSIGSENYTRILLAAAAPSMIADTLLSSQVRSFIAEQGFVSPRQLQGTHNIDVTELDSIYQTLRDIKTNEDLAAILQERNVVLDRQLVSILELSQNASAETGLLLERIGLLQERLQYIEQRLPLNSRDSTTSPDYTPILDQLRLIQNQLNNESVGGVVDTAIVTFRFNSNDLDAEAKELLRNTLNEYSGGNYAFSVVGFADPTGPIEANLHLSVRRAEAVARWIINEMQVPPARVTVAGGGSTSRFTDNDELEENRRAMTYVIKVR